MTVYFVRMLEKTTQAPARTDDDKVETEQFGAPKKYTNKTLNSACAEYDVLRFIYGHTSHNFSFFIYESNFESLMCSLTGISRAIRKVFVMYLLFELRSQSIYFSPKPFWGL